MTRTWREVCRWGAVLPLMLLVFGCANPVQPSVLGSDDIVVGTGAQAIGGRKLTVHYTGWLYDADRPESKGTQFDSSVGGAPYQFTLGLGQVIAGWDQGLPGMRVGGVRRLIVPPSLGYGSSGSGSIPGNRALVFDVELLAVE